MRLRLPGAAALGLLAAFAAHAVAYGTGHAMGGAFHGVLLWAACACALASAIAAGSLAWIGGARTLDGSVLASALRRRLPGLPLLLASAATWFALGEAIEPHHDAASPALLALALLLAAFLILVLARAALGLLATIAIAARSRSFAPRAPSWAVRCAPIPRVARLLRAVRRYARPPPIAVLTRA